MRAAPALLAALACLTAPVPALATGGVAAGSAPAGGSHGPALDPEVVGDVPVGAPPGPALDPGRADSAVRAGGSVAPDDDPKAVEGDGDGCPGGDGSAPSTGGARPAPFVGAADADGAVVAVYANPVRRRDRGEYVLVRRPAGRGWTLSDGEATVRLPPAPGGVVAVSPDPDAVRDRLDVPVIEASGRLRLANDGETLRLRRCGRVVDAVAYGRAPESEVYRDGAWRPLGATDVRPVLAGPAAVEAFVLPDAPGVPVRTLASARRRVLLAGYTLTSWRVARALAAVHARGARVRVLVEGGPVGGVTRREAAVLDWLVRRGVPVAVLAGEFARYRFHHAKYAVADDRAVVLTENWKPAGTGGRSSRGWGAVVHSRRVADHLAAVFRADAGWRDGVSWERYREGRTFRPAEPATGRYPTRFRPRTVRAESVRVLAAPDNAERAILAALRGAEASVLVLQAGVGGRDQPFLQATVAAARRGVRVRVLLSGASYVRAENRRLVAWLNDLAAREGLPLEARVAEPRSRYGKVHAKGVVVDGERVLLGSVNWNNHSVRRNREVAVVLEGEAVAGYYARVFRADWRGGAWRLPWGVLAAVLAAAVAAAAFGRRVEFA